MAKFRVTAPDGNTYQIEAPDGTSPEDVFRVIQGGSVSSAPAEPPPQGAGRFAMPDLAGSPISPVDTATDVAKSAVSGLGKGAIGLATIPGNVEALGRAGINAAGRWARGTDDNLVNPDTALTNFNDLKRRVEGVTGKFYEPKTTAGKYAGTIGEFAPGLALGGGSFAARALGNVIAPAVMSETAGQLTEGTAAEPWARAAGALAGPRMLTPFAAKDPVRQQMVQQLEKEGVTSLTAGQKTGRMPLRWTESALADAPFVGKAQKINEKAGDQFTAAVLKRAGVNAERATPDVLDDAFRTLGAKFEAVAQGAQVPLAPRIIQRAQQVAQRYDSITEPAFRSGLPSAIAKDIADAAQKGVALDGKTYLRWRSDLGTAARTASNPESKKTIYELQKVLDDGAEAYLRMTGKRDLASGFKEARKEYRNLLIIEKAANSAGERSALGVISPSALRNAVKTESPRDYSRGRGQLAPLARAGEAIMKPLPQSGTAPRAAVGSGLAALGGSTMGAEGALASVLTPAIAGHIVMSKPVQRALANQVAPQSSKQLMKNPAILAALLAQSTSGGQ